MKDYGFIKKIYSKEANRLWNCFGKNRRGLRDTYLCLRIIQIEKNGGDFESYFRCSVNEISHRSLLVKSQVKKHVKALELIGLVERKREIKMNKKNETPSFESFTLYRTKELSTETIAEANIKKGYADAMYYHREYKNK